MQFQELYDWIFRQNNDGSSLSMKTVGIVLGLALLLGHLAIWFRAEQSIAAAKNFPRNRVMGIVILAVCTVWTLFLASCMDMGEFYTYRRWLVMLVPAAFVLVVSFVPEFLAVRALGTLMLLVASPILHSAFLQPQTSRLLLPILAYAYIIVGMFFVGMPYLMRDWITWVTQTTGRFKAATLAGVAYGAALLVAAIVDY